MWGLIARISRSTPLVIALILLAIIIYFAVSWRRSPARAKEILIKVFIWVCSVILIFFTLMSLYAFAESNEPVLELAVSCAVIGALGLVITLICRAVFLRHNPHYKDRPVKVHFKKR